jgi:serine/threonine protein phosphatase PrpC
MDGISFFGNTDLGCVRKNNEDTFAVQRIWDEDHILAVVVDGVGGYEGGEVAAAIARDSIVAYLEKYPDGERLDMLKHAVISANNNIFSERKLSDRLGSMSCVLTAVLVEVAERRVNMAHVGDTRLYQYAYGKLHKLSHDQSVVGYLEDNGLISEEEAMLHPQRNIISRDVGSSHLNGSDSEYVETASFPLAPVSSLMLCSDGLTDLVNSARLGEVLSMDMPSEEKVATLIDDAKSLGGKDNVTVVVLDFSLAAPDERQVAGTAPDVHEEEPAPQTGTCKDSVAEHSAVAVEKKGGLRKYLFPALGFFAGVAAGFALSFCFNRGDAAPQTTGNAGVAEVEETESTGGVACTVVQDTVAGDSLSAPREKNDTVVPVVGNGAAGQQGL